MIRRTRSADITIPSGNLKVLFGTTPSKNKEVFENGSGVEWKRETGSDEDQLWRAYSSPWAEGARKSWSQARKTGMRSMNLRAGIRY